MSLLFCGVLSLLVAPTAGTAQAVPGQQDSASCRRFVQEFYDWYTPFFKEPFQAPKSGRVSDVALKNKAALFNPELVRALKADSDAQAHSKDLVGIDFDPFFGSQDPADQYDARRVTTQADKCLVEVWRASPRDTAAQSGKPEVVAEVSFVRGHWQFQNFRYPDLGGDLVSALAEVQKQRRKN
jgi:hypothetical protein